MKLDERKHPKSLFKIGGQILFKKVIRWVI